MQNSRSSLIKVTFFGSVESRDTELYLSVRTYVHLRRCACIASTCTVYRMASPSPTTVKIRNILVLGKTGCGKSTVANRILGQELFKAGGSLQPVTTKPCQQEAEFYDNDSRDLHYKFKLIDTVGLFDPSGRRNKEIVRETKAFFRENVPGLNLILFVYREGRFTQEEKQALDDITKHFKKSRIREISALVVTCCENYDVDRRRKLVEELKIHPSFEAFCELVQKGIYPVGFPDLTTASAGPGCL